MAGERERRCADGWRAGCASSEEIAEGGWDGIPHGGNSVDMDETLAAEEVLQRRRWTTGGPVGEAAGEKQAANGSRVTGRQVEGRVPGSPSTASTYDQAEEAAEVSCGGGSDVRRGAASAECAFAGIGVSAP